MARPSENLRSDGPPVRPAAVTALIFVIVIAALYVGRDIFVPLALAVLLSFMLAH